MPLETASLDALPAAPAMTGVSSRIGVMTGVSQAQFWGLLATGAAIGIVAYAAYSGLRNR